MRFCATTLIHFILVSLWVSSVTSTGPLLDSLTYQIKDVNAMGVDYRHAILEMQFNKDIYYSESWPCSCNNPGLQSCSNATAPIVTEPGPVQTLNRDVWYSFNTTYGALTYTKFLLLQADYVDFCPILVVEVVAIMGHTSSWLDNQQIPSPENHTYIRPGQHPTDGKWICPTDMHFLWGTYYLTIGGKPPLYSRLSFRVRWSVARPVLCSDVPIPSPPLLMPTSADDWFALEDTRSHISTFAQETKKYYRFASENNCSDLAVTCRNVDSTIFSDCDIYLSLTDPHPGPEDFNWDFASYTEAEDTVILRNLCSLDGSGLVVYITVASWLEETLDLEVIASTKGPFITRPVKDVTPFQLQNTFSRGYVKLLCNEGNATEEFRCNFPSVAYANDPFSEFEACSPFRPIPPSRSTLLANHLFPPDYAVVQEAYFVIVPWPIDPNEVINENKKLMYGVLLELSADTDELHRKFVQENITSCQVEFRNGFSDSNGEPITGSYSISSEFTPPCDSVKFETAKSEMLRIIGEMQYQNTSDALFLRNLQIAHLSIGDEYQGCLALLKSYADSRGSFFEFPQMQTCEEPKFSDDYMADACCNPAIAISMCCHGRNQTQKFELISTPHVDAIQASCTIPECSRNVLDGLASLDSLESDQTHGCTAVWNKNASDNVINTLTAFAKLCRLELLGFDLEGIRCNSNSDCHFSGVLCDMTRNRCAYNYTHVLDCWASNISTGLSASLFQIYGKLTEYTPSEFKQFALGEYVKQFCTGPNSMEYRFHYHFIRDQVLCTDSCYNASAGIDFESHCLNRIDEGRDLEGYDLCPVNKSCGSDALSEGICLRHWVPRDPLTGCESEMTCNWMNCSGLNTTECEIQCGSGNICVHCLDGDCSDYSLNDTSCQVGRCSLNYSVTDPSACSLLGSCSVQCNGTECGTRASCESASSCSSFLALTELGMNAACLSPFELGSDKDPLCDMNKTPMLPYGCIDANISTQAGCSEPGAIWIDSNICSQLTEDRCYSSELSIFTLMNEVACSSCGNLWTNLSVIQQGIWTPGVMVPGILLTKKFHSVRVVQDDLDYIAFEKDLEAAAISMTSLEYSAMDYCRYSSKLNAISNILCDCGGSGRSNCYDESQSRIQVAVGRFCPYVSGVILATRYFSVKVNSSAIPPNSSCVFFDAYRTNPQNYASIATASISSEIFLKKPSNSYAILRNSNGAIIGQILSGSIELVWRNLEFVETKTVSLCLRRDDGITHDVENFPYVALGKVANSSGDRIEVPDEVDLAEESGEEGIYCGEISGPGTYILVAYIGGKASSQNIYNTGDQVQIYISALLYLAVCCFAILQIVRFILMHHRGKFSSGDRLALKYGVLGIILGYSIARTVYMLTPPKLFIGNVATVFLFELPTLLFFIMYTSVIHLWIETLYRVKTMDTRTSVAFFKSYVGFNIAITLFYIIFIILFFTLPDDPTLPCLKGIAFNLNAQKSRVNFAYLIFTAVLSIIMALAFIVLGTYLVLGPMSKSTNMRRYLTVMTLSIAGTFGSMFAIRSILILWAVSVQRTIPVLVFTLLEVLPAGVLLYYILPIFPGAFLSGKLNTFISGSKKKTPSNKLTSTTTTSISSSTSADKSIQMKPKSDPKPTDTDLDLVKDVEDSSSTSSEKNEVSSSVSSVAPGIKSATESISASDASS